MNVKRSACKIYKVYVCKNVNFIAMKVTTIVFLISSIVFVIVINSKNG